MEMKKLLPLLALFLALSLVLFGCGKSDDANEQSQGSDASADAQTEEEAGAADAAATGEDAGAAATGGDEEAILQRYVEEMQKQAETQNAATADQMKIEVSALDGALIYTTTYLQDIPTEGMAEQFEATTETLSAVFDVAVDQMKAEGMSSPSIITEYRTKDGELIWSKEFTGSSQE
jgi:hypothetical protein